jgi:acyl carrier protein
MREQTNNENQLAILLIETLNLEGVAANEIDPDEPLFRDGLGLDSIDALEIALAITQKYSIQMRADDENMQQAFGTLRDLSNYIEEHSV